MAHAQHGDTGAFAELYDRHAAQAFRVAQATCHDTGRAENAVREGFLAIWDSRTQFGPANGSFRAWSMRIVQERAIAAESKPVQDQVPARSHTDAMLASLRELPAAEAEVIALAFFGELSPSEIAAQLELPSGTVKGRMRLGLEKLRKQMEVQA